MITHIWATSIIVFVVVAFVVNAIAWGCGFYRYPHTCKEVGPKISWPPLFKAFAIMFSAELILIPFLFLSYNWLIQGDISGHLQASSQEQGWFNLIGIAFVAFFLLLFLSRLSTPIQQAIVGERLQCRNFWRNLVDILIGIVGCLLAYPWMLVLGLGITWFFEYFFHLSLQDQTAVKQIKEILAYPVLVKCTVIATIFVVPIIEELLFRGFLQTWLKNFFTVGKSIAITAAIFACFHFTFKQGIANIELLILLFTLACWMGFVRERQQSLLASIALHATFNAWNLFLLLA